MHVHLFGSTTKIILKIIHSDYFASLSGLRVPICAQIICSRCTDNRFPWKGSRLIDWSTLIQFFGWAFALLPKWVPLETLLRLQRRYYNYKTPYLFQFTLFFLHLLLNFLLCFSWFYLLTNWVALINSSSSRNRRENGLRWVSSRRTSYQVWSLASFLGCSWTYQNPPKEVVVVLLLVPTLAIACWESISSRGWPLLTLMKNLKWFLSYFLSFLFIDSC